jgi:hypothetical protein
MDIMERQGELGRNLFQINTTTLRNLAELQRDNVDKYFELNAAYWDKLPDVKDVSEYFELQKDYNETVWNGVKESAQIQADLVKDALEEAGEAVKVAFRPDEEEEAPVQAAKPAKKPAAKRTVKKKTVKAEVKKPV